MKAAPPEVTPGVVASVPVVANSGESNAKVAPALSEVPEAPVTNNSQIVARVDAAPAKPANVHRTDAGAAQVSGPILGNSRTLLYHFPGCTGYSRVASPVRIEFASAREAERAGYKLSDNCADPSGGRPAAAVIANSRTHDYFLPHCNGYAGTRPEYRVAFASTAEAERAGYKRADKCQ